MHNIGKDQIALVAATIIMIQSGILLNMSLTSRRHKFEADKYADIVTYYNTIIQREDIELTDYDLIALSTLFEEGRVNP